MSAPDRIALRWEPGAAVTNGPLMTHPEYANYFLATPAREAADDLLAALERAEAQLRKVHDDAFRQCGGLALVRSDGKAFSCLELNKCEAEANRARAAIAKAQGQA